MIPYRPQPLVAYIQFDTWPGEYRYLAETRKPTSYAALNIVHIARGALTLIPVRKVNKIVPF